MMKDNDIMSIEREFESNKELRILFRDLYRMPADTREKIIHSAAVRIRGGAPALRMLSSVGFSRLQAIYRKRLL